MALMFKELFKIYCELRVAYSLNDEKKASDENAYSFKAMIQNSNNKIYHGHLICCIS